MSILSTYLPTEHRLIFARYASRFILNEDELRDAIQLCEELDKDDPHYSEIYLEVHLPAFQECLEYRVLERMYDAPY